MAERGLMEECSFDRDADRAWMDGWTDRRGFNERARPGGGSDLDGAGLGWREGGASYNLVLAQDRKLLGTFL